MKGKQFERDFFNDPVKAEWAKQTLGVKKALDTMDIITRV